MSNDQIIHPAVATLTAFAVGDLTENEAKDVEVHIADCETCCETLLNLENDTFVDLVVRSKDVQLEPQGETEDIHQSSAATADSTEELDLLSELANHPRYRTVELLGRGGMGDVFKAEHRMMERTVALKVIKRELFRNPAAVQRFHREVKSAARLSHPNIVTAHDAEQAGDVNFLVMEYVEGVDLARRVKEESALPINEACQYVLQTALGLQHAHEQGMVHRDIKPHNLMVTGDGTLKILDFGLATLVTEAITGEVGDKPSEDGPEKTSTSRLTTMGTMMGTPEFISPEQASEPHAVDIRSDIYSLGCTFYYLLTGRPPFTEGSAMDRVKAHSNLEAEPIENVRDDIPPNLADVVRRMMAKEPAARFQTPAEVADALGPFVDAHRTNAAARMEAEHRVSTAPSRRSWWPPTNVQSLAFGAFALVLGAIIHVATDGGTMVVESEDENVEITVRPVSGEPQDESKDHSRFRITDTLTGSSIKWLRRGEYVLALQGNANTFELSREHLVVKRGGRVVVKVTRRKDPAVPDIGPRVRKAFELKTNGEPSPDGSYLTWTDVGTGDLAMIELASGKIHRLTDEGSWGYPHGETAFHVWSPDAQRIAYSWFIGKDDVWTTELRVVGRDGSEPRVVYRNEEHSDLHPFQWSKDGESVLVAYKTPDKTTELALISVADGLPHVLKSLGRNWPINASISPDGQYVVYDVTEQATSRERDIHILATDRRWEEVLVEHPNHDYAPVWTPDGGRIVFTSNRKGSTKLWMLEVRDGRPVGSPKAVETVDMHRMVPLGFSQNGNYFYKSTVSGHATGDVYIATLDPTSGKVTSDPSMLSRQYEGLNTLPSWSRNGQDLVYASPRGPLTSQQGTRDFVIRSFATGRERILTPNINWNSKSTAHWSPDGRSFYVIGQGGEGRGIFKVDKESGNATFVTRVGGRHPQAALSRDGHAIYYTRGAQIIERELASGKEQPLCKWREAPKPQAAIHSLAVSPDGAKLAFADLETLAIVPTTGGEPQELLNVVETGDKMMPTEVGIAWTPDGQSLIFGTGASFVGAQRLWKIAIGGGEPRNLGVEREETAGFRHITLHPEGRHLVFTGRSGENIAGPTWVLENFLRPLKQD